MTVAGSVDDIRDRGILDDVLDQRRTAARDQ